MSQTDSKSALRSNLELLAPFFLPPSVLLALLYYFGFTRTSAFYDQFGIPIGLLNFGVADLVIRSLDVFLHPLRLAVALFVIGSLIDRFVRKVGQHEANWPVLRFLGSAALLFGIALAIAFDRLYGFGDELGLDPLDSNLGWTLAVIAIGYSVRVLTIAKDDLTTEITQSRPTKYILGVSFSFLVLVGVFITTARYARVVGKDQAKNFIAAADRTPDVVVTSNTPLGISESTLEVTYHGPDSVPIYQYSGLKFLAEVDGSYLLYPSNRPPNEGIIVLAKSESIGVQLSGGN